jgi:hypothetical protein
MHYMLMVYESAAELAKRKSAQFAAYMAPWASYTQALQGAGVLASGNGLMPPDTATTLRFEGDKRVVHDGPYADTKEQLGGYYVLDVPSLEVAMQWAARCPCLPSGAVELRPLMTAP